MQHLGINFFNILLRLFDMATLLPEKPLVIVITSYNNSKWVKKNLESIFNQEYTNYRVVYIDDASSDETMDLASSIVKENAQESRFTFIRNSARKGGLCNLYEAVVLCKDEEIIVNVDGDDWLANSQVFKKLNTVYSKKDIWMTHGTLIEYPQNTRGWSKPIPQQIIKTNAFRTHRCPSHLKTFYTWLFKKIDVEDLKIAGEFFPMTWDQAIMFPMIEMAGHHHAFIQDTLYVYNRDNPMNDHKVNEDLQKNLENLIRSKSKYEKLSTSSSRYPHATNP